MSSCNSTINLFCLVIELSILNFQYGMLVKRGRWKGEEEWGNGGIGGNKGKWGEMGKNGEVGGERGKNGKLKTGNLKIFYINFL